jgi:plasmid maintenance system antidote protein VapI
MPKTRFDRVPRDLLKELVLGRKAALDMSLTRLAEKMHITRSQLSTILEKPSANWTIGNAIALTAALDIPIAEMREAIRK